MDYRKLKIVFMGTPEFAVASLDALLQAGYTISGVVTAPDKPGGRGMQMQQSEVKKFALEKGLRLLQPLKLKDPTFLEELKEINPDVQVVVAFRMLPELVWNAPPMGTINVHGSLLPQYRGAAPINWAVINGEKETGVTTFKLKHEIDTGNILLQATLPIGPDETAGSVHDRMKHLGAATLVQTIKGLANGTLKEIVQQQIISESDSIKHAPKIFTETTQINWNQSVDKIYNLIRGLSPFPTSFTELEGKILKIYSASKELETPSIDPGQFLTDNKTWLKFAASDGYLQVKDVQLQGKKRMQIGEFLRGYRFTQNPI